MYRRVIKPVLFSLTIEQAHHAVLLLLRIIGLIPGGRWLLRKCYAVEHPALEREVFGIRFANPNGEAFRELAALGFGFVEVGTVTPRPQAGNPRPRVFRLPKDNAIINRIGLANRGLEATIRHLRRPHDGVIVGCTPRPPPRTLRRTTSNSSAASISMRTISPSTSAATTPAAKARRTRANISFRYSTRCSTSAAGRTSTGRSCSKSRPTCRTR